MSKKSLLVLVLLLFALGNALAAAAQAVVGSTPVGPIWEVQRAILGGLFGVALSPDGKAVVYIGMGETDRTGNSMFLVDLETGKQTLLQGPDDPYTPSQPSFSPGGKRIVFVLSGPTFSYPSDVYTIGIDGKGLTKLTQSLDYTDAPAYPPELGGHYTGAAYQRYYGRPRYSPDGSRILLSVDDEVEGRELTAAIDAGGGPVEVLAEGRPRCWSPDGKAVYYTHKGLLTRMDLETRATRTVPLAALESRTPLGRMAGRDWFAFKLGNGRIGWYDFETPTPVPQFLGEWSVPGVKMVGREKLELKGFDWSGSNEVLLWYQGEETERFEVLRIFDPTAFSP